MTARTQPEALPLWPDEVDVELPFEVTATLDPATRAALDLGAETIRLRHALTVALDAYVDAFDLGRPTLSAERFRQLRALAGTPAEAGLTPEERRDEGTARAAAKWTDEEVEAVDLAIVTVRNRVVREAREKFGDYAGAELAEFTTADVWQQLDGRVPVTKGIAGRMLAAKSAGLIANTGRTVIAPRESTGPNHGQRLTVWRAL